MSPAARELVKAGIKRTPARRMLPRRPHVPKEAWAARMSTLAATLDRAPAAPSADHAYNVRRVRRRLRDADTQMVWLVLAVLSARLPSPDHVVDAHRDLVLHGAQAVFRAARKAATRESVNRQVEVVTGVTVVDMGDLVLFPLGTGIQRVARMVGRAWQSTQAYSAVGWTPDMDAMYRLDDNARDIALGLPTASDHVRSAGDDHPETVVVPWDCTYVLPELAIQPRRCLSLNAMARFSRNRCAVIGFDCVPLTSPETTAGGFPAVFALNLAAVAHFDLVVTISQAAATEYGGWRRMLGGAGLPGPEIVALSLPVQVPDTTPESLAAAEERFLVGDLPLVLCVGSHEPRKNHLAVLHAAEQLWRSGEQFSLTFVGGNSWGSEEFTERRHQLERAGRPVEAVSRLGDNLLWAAYRLARFSVFPSLNEGFGLPVAESIAAGTPAVTSDFGSMREIGQEGGALLVDPRDDVALTEALRTLLTDDTLLERLKQECAARTPDGWDDYADALWVLAHRGDGTVSQAR
ncbi:MAG: glycosyltransferase family 4 protein [Actinomycetota bacterium]|nr:glycosyltransferase family 4 protein [Actinomycetota bacterium]